MVVENHYEQREITQITGSQVGRLHDTVILGYELLHNIIEQLAITYRVRQTGDQVELSTPKYQ